MGKFYRFRRCSALLGEWKELETQTIFFAEPNSLNDPMEGYRDIVWKGDDVVWMNLFKNYLFCLEHVFSLYKIGGDDFDIKDDDILVFSGGGDLPTPEYKDIFLRISSEFTNHEIVIRMVDELSKRKYPVRRDELTLYFTQLQFIALRIIDKVHNEYGLARLFSSTAFDNSVMYEKNLVKLLDDGLITKVDEVVDYNESGAGAILAVMKARHEIQMELGLLRKIDGSLINITSNKEMIFLDFSRRYLSRLEKLLFPSWYTACFMTECKDSAVWGHYGENHTGVCLIFESDEDEGVNTINLNQVVGLGGDGEIHGFSPCKLHPIDYISGVGVTDFFTMLGRLPIPKLNSEWYTFNSKRSMCSRGINESVSLWREKYWDSFISDITKKTQHWEYENEYRMIIIDDFSDYSSPERRALTYDFSSLKGIIFGLNTQEKDKISIIEIIKRKCRVNKINDFKFYQAYYNPKTKSIEHAPLELLNKFIKPES
ncbi:DUF2971 domain-containing protein [Enterobacter asburiae]